MSQNDAPPAPDYSPIADAQKEMAGEALALQREQFAWAKQTYAENKEVTDKVVSSFLKTQDENAANAAKDRARYESIYQPLEDSLAEDAKSYASPERKEREMGRAEANVAQQFGAARRNAQRNLESYGLNPADTRYAALDIGVRAQQAAAAAGAGNAASDMVDATGRALRSEAINVGKGYPGQIAGTYGTALTAGTGANQQGLATTASGSNTMGTPTQWGALGANAYSGAAQTMNTGYSNQLQSAKYNQDAQGQWLTLAGGALGAGAKLASAGFFGVADGGAIEEGMGDDIGGLPTQHAIPAAPDGGVVPRQVSPSGGRAVDDVPAKLSEGEFIMPKDVVAWYGQKHMYNLIEKASGEREQKKQSTGAIPKMRSERPRQALQVA